MLRSENTDESAARLENLEEFVNAAVDYDKQEAEGLRDFIDHAAFSSDTDKFDRNAAVTMMTVHAAKGLEFPIVFLVGLEDGIFPHARTINDPNELEEERRLAYVAITRAEKSLYITHAMRRRVYGVGNDRRTFAVFKRNAARSDRRSSRAVRVGCRLREAPPSKTTNIRPAHCAAKTPKNRKRLIREKPTTTPTQSPNFSKRKKGKNHQ